MPPNSQKHHPVSQPIPGDGTQPYFITGEFILDTRGWFPEATQTSHLETHPGAIRALNLISPDERAAVLRYYHLRDAKMALGSALLKRFTIARLSPTPWSQSIVSRSPAPHGKPIFIPPPGSSPVSFNVSHQAGLVVCVAMPYASAQIGVDVVCTSERRDRDMSLLTTNESGWREFVDMHADVFSPKEVSYLKYQLLPARAPATVALRSVEAVAERRLREFYALWALREAYIKLTGEALLASWLKDLEFRNFRAPKGTASFETPADEDLQGRLSDDDAQVIRKFDVRMKERKLEDVNICLRSVGPDYMIATAVRLPQTPWQGSTLKLGPFTVIPLEDVLAFAEASM